MARLLQDSYEFDKLVFASNIMVNTPEAHAVRIGRYQAKPPVTRIVVDVAPDVNYEVFVDGNRLLVNLRGASTGMKGNPAPPAIPAVNARNMPQQPVASKPAGDVAAKAKAESAAFTVAGANSSAARIENVSATEKLSGKPGNRTVAALDTAVSAARTSHSIPDSRTNR